MLTYKESLTKQMNKLAKDRMVRFIGYNTAYGHRFNGTLDRIPKEKCIEMPVAENLIVGLAIGMALEGFHPVVCIERMDFLWACGDAIINHLDKAKQLGWPPLKVIIRTCVGCRTPLDPGIQHSGDYVAAFKAALSAPVLTIGRCDDPAKVYQEATEINGPVMVVEYRELYSTRPTASSKLKTSRKTPPKLVRQLGDLD
jgi:pyruvate dehydrogenase E1 component beta subunit